MKRYIYVKKYKALPVYQFQVFISDYVAMNTTKQQLWPILGL